MNQKDLVVLGNLIVDDIVYEEGRTRMAQPGGATLYVTLAARLFDVSVGLVTVVGDDYPEAMLEDLAARGIDLGGVRRLERPGLRTWLLYEGRRRHVIHRLGGPTHAEVSPTVEDIPARWESRAYHLAPMPFDVHRALTEALASRDGALVSLDPYELLSGELEPWRGLLSGIDVFFLSEDEMLIEGGLRNPRPVLKELCRNRLGRVVFKRAARGGVAYDAREDAFLEWRARAAAVVDPTGAGDAFAGGVLAGLLRGEPMPRALEHGVVAASFALEGEGASGLLAATPEGAWERLQEWFSQEP